MYDKLIAKEAKLCIIGLGYVGLPIALQFAKSITVIGFDLNDDRVNLMKNNIDPSEELAASEFEGCDISFTSSIEDIREASFYIVAVPTPIDERKMPVLDTLLKASNTVGQVISKGDYVVFESTVYPGCTEEDCIPVVEEASGLEYKTDFKAGYSPERINPGDKEHTISNVIKVVSGCDEESLEEVAKVYEIVVKAGVHRTPNIKVAEAAKIIENTQRDVNIALINELSIIFNKMSINTYDVLEAANTKWNFLNFQPGLVGGHCIGVDPYYLTYRAEGYGYHSRVINSGRYINDSMGFYIAKQVVKKVIASDKNISESKILVMGATFKENVSDIRNSKVADVIKELKSFSVNVEIHDPYASSDDLQHEYGFGLVDEIGKDYDAVIVAVNHKDYLDYDTEFFKSIMTDKGVLADLKGIYMGKIEDIEYWTL